MSSLTFAKTKVATGRYGAHGDTFSYLIKRDGRKWFLTVYTQNRVHFESNKTTLILHDMPVWTTVEESLTLAKEWAQAFNDAPHGEYETGRRAAAAAEHIHAIVAAR